MFSILSIKVYKFITPKLAARLYTIENKQKKTKILKWISQYI